MNTPFIKNSAIVIALALLLSSCEKDIKVKLPDYPTQLVVYSNTIGFPNYPTPITATVGKSISILKYNGLQDQHVSNAKLDIYTDGNYTATMLHDPTENKYFSSVIPEEGKTYTIKASAPGYNDVAEATAPMLMHIPIKNIKHVPFARNGSNGPEDEITITFDDPAGTNDYYMISFLSPGTYDMTSQYYANICVTTLDPVVETISTHDVFSDDNNCLYGDLFVKDELFNGTAKQIKFYTNSYSIQPYQDINGDTIYSSIAFNHITEDYYRYRKTSSFARDNQGNPFAEPTNVYTNVKNGRGIFSISTPDVVQIR